MSVSVSNVTRLPTRQQVKDAVALVDTPAVRIGLVVAGVAGLAALGFALFSQRRANDDLVRRLSAATLVPLTSAVTPQAERVWAQTQPWRDRVSRIVASIDTDEVRAAIADRLTQWIQRIR